MATLDPFVELLSGEPVYWRAGSGSVAVSTRSVVRIPQNVLALTGSAEAIAVAAGTPEQTHALTVAVSAVVETAGAAEQVHALTAAASSVAQASGILTLTRALTGTVEAVVQAVGTLEQVHAATGAIQTVAETAGAGSQTHKLTAASSAVASAVGVLTVVGLHPVTGDAEAVAVAVGIPEQVHAVTVTTNAVAETAATPEQIHAVTVDVVSVASASGVLTIGGANNLVGAAQAVAVTTGALQQTHLLTGQVDASIFTGEAPPRPYLDLPGTSGHHATSPDHADFNLVDTFFVGAYVALDDWTPTAANAVISQFHAASNQRSWQMRITTTGVIQIRASDDGTANEEVNSTGLGYTDGTANWVGFDFDGGVVRFYEGGTDSRTPVWVQKGSSATFATVTTVHDSTGVIEVGANNGGNNQLLAG